MCVSLPTLHLPASQLNSWYLGGSPVPEDLNHPVTQDYASAALPMPAAAVSEESCSLSLSRGLSQREVSIELRDSNHLLHQVC